MSHLSVSALKNKCLAEIGLMTETFFQVLLGIPFFSTLKVCIDTTSMGMSNTQLVINQVFRTRMAFLLH